MSQTPPTPPATTSRGTIQDRARVRRRNLHLLCATPAVLVILLIVAIALANGGLSAGVPSWYRTMADDAFDAGDFRTAAVCYERLLQATPADAAITFDLAQSLRAIGQDDASLSLLARIAPPDRPGYAPAQLAVARRLLGDHVPDTHSLDLAEEHVNQVLNVSPADASAILLMAELSALRGNWVRVDEFVSQLNPLPSALCKRLAEIARRQNNGAETERWSNAAGR